MKFLLLVAVALSVASVESNPVPAGPDSSVVHKATRDTMSNLKGLASNSEFMNKFISLVATVAETMVSSQPSKRDLLGVIPEALRIPSGLFSDIVAGSKLAANDVLADLKKRSVGEEGHLEKREIFTDLFNMLVGNFEGAMTGMDIV